MEDKVAFVRELIDRGKNDKSTKVSKGLRPVSYLDATNFHPDLYESGIDILRQGKTAVVMVAGGISSRMGIPGLRGNLAIGPVTDRSIFSLQLEKIAAIQRRYAASLPVIILTSPAVHMETVDSFRKNNFGGLPETQFFFIQQDTLPVLDAKLNPVVQHNSYLEYPTGHGGFFKALINGNVLDILRIKGIEYFFYFQYPNVLEQICDPVMLGYHFSKKADFTLKSIYDYDENERLGKCLAIDGQYKIVEYYYKERIEQAVWNSLPASIATHVISLAFIEKLKHSNIVLPYHVTQLHQDKALFKVEQYIFDLMDYTQFSELIIVDRKNEYEPVKSLSGINSLKNAAAALNNLYVSWLKRAGINLNENIKVEISPLFALDVNDIMKKSSGELAEMVIYGN